MPEHLLCEEGKRPHSLVYSSDQRGVSMLLSPPNLSVYTPTLLAFTTHSRKLQSFDHLALCVAFAAAITSSMPCAKKTFGLVEKKAVRRQRAAKAAAPLVRNCIRKPLGQLWDSLLATLL